MADFSDYVIYVDESGDHSLARIDPHFPVFVLTLCVFRKDDYIRRIVPSLRSLKFRWFGHDMVVLHEREIRKHSGAFGFLENSARRADFLGDLSGIIEQADFSVIGVVIDKRSLADRSGVDGNPYTYALRLSMDRLHTLMVERGQRDRISHCIFERRGTREDEDLELAFRRITDGDNDREIPLADFRIVFADKRTNSSGLQIADLTARPLGVKYLRPDQLNRAYDIIARKFLPGDSAADRGAGPITFPR